MTAPDGGGGASEFRNAMSPLSLHSLPLPPRERELVRLAYRPVSPPLSSIHDTSLIWPCVRTGLIYINTYTYYSRMHSRGRGVGEGGGASSSTRNTRPSDVAHAIIAAPRCPPRRGDHWVALTVNVNATDLDRR